MTLEHAELEISGDPAGTGETTGTFVMESVDVAPRMEYNPLFDSQSGGILSQGAALFGLDKSGFRLDLGAGVAAYELQFNQWEGSSQQWGDDPNQGLTRTSATGQSVLSQISVLTKYLQDVSIDSGNPATLSWGEFSSSGVYSPLKVYPASPSQLQQTRDESSTYSGTLTMIRSGDADEIYHGEERTG